MKAKFGNSATWITTSLLLVSMLWLAGCGKKNQPAAYVPPPVTTPGGGIGGGGFIGNCVGGMPLNGQGSPANLQNIDRPALPGSNSMTLIITDPTNSGNYLSGYRSIGAQAYLMWGSLNYIAPNPYSQYNAPLNFCSTSGGVFNNGRINVELQAQTLANAPQMPGFYQPYQQQQLTTVIMRLQGTIDQINRFQGQASISIFNRWSNYQTW